MKEEISGRAVRAGVGPSVRAERALVEGRDYYFEPGGLMVFTSEFLLARGYCCENNCRHCPYSIEENK